MKSSSLHLLFSTMLICLLVGCNLPEVISNTPVNETVPTKVALTLAALTQPAQLTTEIPPIAPTSALPGISPEPSTIATEVPTNTQIPTLTPTETPGPTITPRSAPGTIAGSISGYPYGSLPSLAIVAYGQESPYYYSYMITGAGQSYFEMTTDFLLPGHYQVVAYDSSGHAGGCNLNAAVVSNTTVNCDITNWSGSYRAKPSGVPNP
jgi:hypothetical protein